MRVIPPITITDAILTASSLVEIPPAPYVAGTTYAADVLASTGTVGGVITAWKSLQGANIGHDPLTNPTWWQNIGTTYSVYDVNATYALGARVIDPAAHLVYESQIAANKGQSLATGTAWLKVPGTTNKWMAFDNLRNTQAVAPVDIVQTLTLTERVSSIAVIGIDARYVTIKMTVAGVEKYSVTVDLNTRKSFSWRQYYTGKFRNRTSVQFFNLPLYRNPVITVTVSKPNGQRGVGGIVVGNAVYVGDVQYEATSDHLNFSTVDRDTFGNLELVPKRSVPKNDLQVWFDKSLTSQILDVREQLNGKPAVWSGLDDFTLDYFEPLFIYGIHKEFSLNLKEHDYGIITLQVEEM